MQKRPESKILVWARSTLKCWWHWRWPGCLFIVACNNVTGKGKRFSEFIDQLDENGAYHLVPDVPSRIFTRCCEKGPGNDFHRW